MITLKKQTNENGSYLIEIKFKDENNKWKIPYNLTWTLTDLQGNIINNCENVEISNPDNTIYISLNGDDLTPGWKIVTLKGKYDSTNAPQLNIRETFRFYVTDLIEEDL